MTSITAAAPVPLQVSASGRIGPDGDAGPPATPGAAGAARPAKVISVQGPPLRAPTPTAAPPLSPGVMAVMIEVQERLGAREEAGREAARAVARALARADARGDLKDGPGLSALLQEALTDARAWYPNAARSAYGLVGAA